MVIEIVKSVEKEACCIAFFLTADAQTLKAVARITNLNFTDALLDPNSEEYKMLSEKIRNEVQGEENRSLCKIAV